nr:MAG: major capsid protein [Microvirus Sku110]
MSFKNINATQAKNNNELLNESERNDTLLGLDAKTSTFTKSFTQATTFNSGKLIPILCQEVYPGDTYDINAQTSIKLSAPASTPFNKIIYDVSYFFVPYEQIDKEFHHVMGENDEMGAIDSFIPFPTLKLDVNTSVSTFSYTENDLGNYFNIPINVNLIGTIEHLNIYPYLAYIKIWNDYFRDQNLQNTADYTSWYDLPNRQITDLTTDGKTFYETLKLGKGLAPASKLADYFTTTLPYRQKGAPIQLGGTDSLVLKPLVVENSKVAYPDFEIFTPIWHKFDKLLLNDRGTLSNWNQGSGKLGTQLIPSAPAGDGTAAYLSLSTRETKDPFISGGAFDVNAFRESVRAQQYLENLALMGSRYVEQLKSIWKIDINPLEIGRAQCIGGFSDTLVFNNVQQTSETTASNQLGKIASSLYNQVNGEGFSFSGEQHGLIIGILVVRTPLNYGAQGLPKIFSYKEGLDLFNPIFNGLGEQPILNQEIYLKEKALEKNKETFGFNEPFLNTKYNISNANGFLSLNSKTSLFSNFLYGEKLTDTPVLSDKYIQYDPNIIGNTLFKVDNSNIEFYHQFLALIEFDITYTTEQPLFDVPGIHKV